MEQIMNQTAKVLKRQQSITTTTTTQLKHAYNHNGPMRWTQGATCSELSHLFQLRLGLC